MLGAIVFRFIFILAGAALLDAFHFTIYIFGAILLITGWKMARSKGHGVDPSRNPVLFFMARFIPIGKEYHGQRFFVKDAGRWIATPLFAVLVVIETSDILFAIDSIPAIFAITTDPFIVFSSNAFAILGLRSLYFMLAGHDRSFRVPEDRPRRPARVRGHQDHHLGRLQDAGLRCRWPRSSRILAVSIGYSLWKTRGLPPTAAPRRPTWPPTDCHSTITPHHARRTLSMTSTFTASAAHAAMACPKCAGEMRAYERSGVIVDQCRECRGIFLDRGELERLVDLEADPGDRRDPRAGRRRPPRRTARGPARRAIAGVRRPS